MIRHWCQLGSNLPPNLGPKSTKNRSKSQPKSKQIFILGNIRSPGTFTLNAFSTPLNALISAGGILKNSSLREVTLLRNGIEYSKVDFYDFLIRGDSSKLDTVLQEGDTMLVGGLTNSVSIYGEVNRPAVYEFKEGETLEDIISFSLGFSPFADKRSIAITRTLASGQKTILNPVNLANFEIKNGDVIKVNASNISFAPSEDSFLLDHSFHPWKY